MATAVFEIHDPDTGDLVIDLATLTPKVMEIVNLTSDSGSHTVSGVPAGATLVVSGPGAELFGMGLTLSGNKLTWAKSKYVPSQNTSVNLLIL